MREHRYSQTRPDIVQKGLFSGELQCLVEAENIHVWRGYKNKGI